MRSLNELESVSSHCLDCGMGGWRVLWRDRIFKSYRIAGFLLLTILRIRTLYDCACMVQHQEICKLTNDALSSAGSRPQ